MPLKPVPRQIASLVLASNHTGCSGKLNPALLMLLSTLTAAPGLPSRCA